MRGKERLRFLEPRRSGIVAEIGKGLAPFQHQRKFVAGMDEVGRCIDPLWPAKQGLLPRIRQDKPER